MRKGFLIGAGIFALATIAGCVLADRDFQDKRKEIDMEADRIKRMDRDMAIKRQMDDISRMINNSLRANVINFENDQT